MFTNTLMARDTIFVDYHFVVNKTEDTDMDIVRLSENLFS